MSANLLPPGEQGAVFVFKGGASLPRGNVTRGCNRLDQTVEPCPIDKTRYCNLGWSLATADLNQNGFLDLIIGSPFVANGNQHQSGALWVVYSSREISAKTDISVEDDAMLLLRENQQYGWLGYSVLTQPKLKGQGSWVLVSQPTYRLCAK